MYTGGLRPDLVGGKGGRTPTTDKDNTHIKRRWCFGKRGGTEGKV